MAKITSKNDHLKLLSICIAIVYLWFGTLKFFPNVSPAEDLAKNTIDALTFSLIPSNVSIILLAIWETIVGFCLIFGILKRQTIYIAIVHMIFTFSPILLFPDLVFENGPFQLTIIGQYIIKNIIILASLLILLKMQNQTKNSKSSL